ncbi:MAG TPA: hypothetical protein DCZ94_14545 [Lentisphaeria bacterium]|nr:MAG: hypothetical protein A2X48_09775 [Lentisphaerae bacterium GWF2_49_21]HBC88166.1 hypothetical protein [Lentisphaeria bacterium]
MKKYNPKSLFKSLWISVLILTVFIWFYPVNISILRYFLILALPFLLCGVSVFIWRRKRIRYLPFIITVIIVIFILIPGRSRNKERLRIQYARCLEKYEGVRYIWGGETFLGIDCSGLVRKGLIDALFYEGIQTLNPELIRNSLFLWWNDCSARSLKEGYRNLTTPLFDAESVNSIKTDQLEVGDIAVTSDGVHVLAYLGNNSWIEADPGIRKVIKAETPVKDNPWFEMKIKVLRWNILK